MGCNTVVSFDIFDTIITRNTYKPTDLFYFIGKVISQNGILKCEPRFFQKVRIEAERMARKASRFEEITLDEIYAILRSLLNLDEQTVEYIKKLEMKMERKSLAPINKNLRRLSNKSILISDTYLGRKLIEELLLSLGITEYHDMFISSEYRMTKNTGNLFKIVSQVFHVEKHIGDNPISDFKVPQKMGIIAELYTGSSPSRYEEAIYNNRNLPYELRSILAGTMKAARLSKNYDNVQHQTIHEVSSNVIGPFLFSYVYWILMLAERVGLQKLYFFSRDGQILKDIADILIENFNFSVKTKYLYVSRNVIYSASLMEEADIYEMFKLLEIENFKSLLKELLSDRSLLGESSPSVNSGFSCLKELILKLSERRRSILVEYLKQEGFNRNSKLGVVDVGWKGRLQYFLSKILEKESLYNSNYGITGFYIALLPPILVQSYKADKKFCFLYGRYQKLINPEIIETFTAATHGLVIGYKRMGEKIVPYLKEEENNEMLRWGLKFQHSSILYFVKLFTRNCLEYDLRLDYSSLREIAITVYKLFITSPSRREAFVYGRLRHSADVLEKKSHFIAYPLSSSDIIRLPFNFRIKGKEILPLKVKTYWIQGSLALSLQSLFKSKTMASFLSLRRVSIHLIKQLYEMFGT